MKKKYILKGVTGILITLFIVSVFTFTGFDLIKSDPATIILGTNATAEKLAALRHEMGLDRPLIIRYLSYIGGIFKGDLGYSYIYQQSVSSILADKIKITFILILMSFIIIIVFSFIFSLISARYRNTLVEHIITIINQINMSIPPFFLGLILTFIFGFVLKAFTPGKYVDFHDNLKGFMGYMIFPAITIALPKIAMTVKLLTNSIHDEMKNDYVRTAVSRGNSETRILFRHVLKNAIMPVVTFLGMLPADMIASSVIVEQVFSIPGLGRLLVSSIFQRDYPVVQAIVLLIALVVVTLNFAVDLLYKSIDKRIKSDR